MPTPTLERLLEGNARFAKGEIAHPRRRPEDFRPLAEGQRPVATVISCADSRVTPEILFDVGIGDLFVIRVAGNDVHGAGPSVTGSVEFAVAELGVPLIMILGHSQCGALRAAIQHIRNRDVLTGALKDLVESVEPAVAAAKEIAGDLLDNAVRANVERGVSHLKTLAPIIAPRVRAGAVRVVGATYDLATGEVTLLC
jgi:carbonic anhydrase